jgi:hypothetical protein
MLGGRILESSNDNDISIATSSDLEVDMKNLKKEIYALGTIKESTEYEPMDEDTFKLTQSL